MAIPRRALAAAGAAVLLIGGALLAWGGAAPAAPKPVLGLLTSLPIYWPESASISETLEQDGERHWARTELERAYRLEPLDTLDPASLARIDRLLLAQPRPLGAAENVALDDWVRRGGHLLLFADPMLTEASRFPLGDRRRPQDVVLLSPILARWGLELTFDPDQPSGESTVEAAGTTLPVQLSGRWRVVTPGAPATCRVTSDGLAARCVVGKGRVLAIADAAVLERDRDGGKALSALSEQAFGE